MKAQMVKNAVIVPVGAKGGFVVKRPPESGDREALLEEVEACYRTFIRGMLDVTDNIVAGETVPAPDVVRYDDDDPYLVVAADKGTATFSDIANSVALEYGYWLGDAFASGGSSGYDHKEMGITAAGAWESVKRHFRELGHNVSSQPFSVVGIGDMSGDVFGNGMLLSRRSGSRGVQPPRDLPRPRPGPGDQLVGGAQAPVRAAAVVLVGLRRGADLERRRRLAAHSQVHRAVGGGAGGPRDRGLAGHPE